MALMIPTASGSYTPTATINANLDSVTAQICKWLRVGNVVTVSGYVQIDCTTASTSTSMYLTLPVASDFTAITDLAGSGASHLVFGLSAAIYADTTGNRAYMVFNNGGSVTSQSIFFTFQYAVL